ncbi:hypothetical protein [Parabacteroides gordonii]|uniref:Uncharacterized protein n=1 Tax=Parabacteroides gordonii MS-1 = DSM 23371 TaxID=1203610 RepID=A0A0F5JBS3_9BACT|nr:hypothetical protein [Parabacteroides gordonii]KKB55326.1 hypothetical protein HMPREF1536_02791 [Parabacteroides gordonii MS-1 = DSM 23371]MCA5581879.1 hypothetical protein [Parabacteroides gordonii]
MADNKEQVILEVVIKNDAASKRLKENKQDIAELREEQALLNKTTLEGKEAYKQYEDEIKNLRKHNVLLNQEIRNNNKSIEDQEGSLQSMRAELSRLNKVYVNLSQIERESAKGRDLQKKIKSLNEEIKTSEQKLGDYRRSVGGYEEAINSAVNQTGIFSKIQGTLREVMSPFLALYKKVQLEIKTLTADYKLNSAATTQMSGAQKAAAISSNLLSTGLKILKIALISTGIGAIVVALGSLVAYLTKTQKGTELLSNVMAGLGAAINVIIDRVAKFGGALVKVFSGDFKGAAKDMKATFAGIGDELQREIKLAYELNDISQQLEKQEVMLNMQRAAGRKEIERLKMISDDTTKSTKERIAAAKQASEIEQADMKQQIELGEKKLANLLGQKEVTQEVRDMLEAVSSGSMKADDAISKLGLSESTISDLREFSDLFQNVVDKQRDSYTKQIELQNKTNSIRKESSQKALEIKKDQQAKELELIRQAEDAALSLVKEGIEKQRQTVNVQYDRQIEDLKRKLSTEKNLTDAAKKALNDSIILAEQKRDADLKKLSDDSIQAQIKKETERIQLQLDSVKEGTSREHNLRLSLIEQNRQAELAANLQQAEELRQSEADINAAYNKLIADENEAFRKEQFDKQSEYIRLEWENKILQVKEGTLQEYDLKVQQAQADYDLFVNMDAATKAALYESDAAYENAKLQGEKNIQNAIKARINAENEAVLVQMAAVTTITDAFSSMLDSFAEDNEALAAFAKTVALFNIGLSTAEAISKGVAAAQSVPFPGNIAAIATTIASVMANIAKAKQLVNKEKNPKFADGGEITGPSHASGGVLIEAEGGEGIINKHSMSNPLLRSIASAVNVAGGGVPFSNVPIFPSGSSGGFDTAELKAVFVEALKEMPVPVVSVVEFTEAQNRVKMIQNNSTI